VVNLTLLRNKQEILFLVRDFCDTGIPRGIEGGRVYLSEILEKYQHWPSAYWKPEPKCFLFSYPGDKIDSEEKGEPLEGGV